MIDKTSGRKPQAFGVLKMEHETVEYSCEVARYLKWRYGIGGKGKAGVHKEDFAVISEDLSKINGEADEK